MIDKIKQQIERLEKEIFLLSQKLNNPEMLLVNYFKIRQKDVLEECLKWAEETEKKLKLELCNCCKPENVKDEPCEDADCPCEEIEKAFHGGAA